MAQDRLLLSDGSSHLLLSDGSVLLLSTSSVVEPGTDPNPTERSYAVDSRRGYGLASQTTHLIDARRTYRRL